MTRTQLTIVTFALTLLAACSDASFDVEGAVATTDSANESSPLGDVANANTDASPAVEAAPTTDTTPATPDTLSPDTAPDAGTPRPDARPADAPKPDPTMGRPCESAFDCEAGRCCEIETYGKQLITYCRPPATMPPECPPPPLGKDLP